MSDEELASRLFEVQGFLVVSSLVKLEIGHYLTNMAWAPDSDVKPNVAVKVIGESNRQEIRNQSLLAATIDPSTSHQPSIDRRFFYRVEPAD